MSEPIRIDGLAAFSRSLKKISDDMPKGLRIALNEAADIVVGHAKTRVPRRTGRAAATIKAKSTRTAVRVQGGSTRVPYYPWLDFGGRVGRRHSVKRPFRKDGRYIYAAYFDNKDEFTDVLEAALSRVVIQAGLELSQ